tara:strand:- start:32167 stop:32883 length:717 start_codon:yes stop_codon:yes gene_type:complete
MKHLLLVAVLFTFGSAQAWQVTLSCSPQGHHSADIDDLVVVNSDGKPRDSMDDVTVTATARSIVLGKKSFKDIALKGTRSHTSGGFLYKLRPDKENKMIKYVAISDVDGSGDLASDEVVSEDGAKYLMACSEVQALDCSLPAMPVKIPKDSFWAGGCEKGAWFHVGQIKPKQIKLKIFRAETGELLKDAWYDFSSGCQVKSKDSLKNDILSFDGESILLKRINPKEEPAQNCFLKPSR